LDKMKKPKVDLIEGLSPAISIEQKNTSKNPRSTVATVTEIYDYMRVLYARAGTPYSPFTGKPIQSQTISQIVDKIKKLPKRAKTSNKTCSMTWLLLFPLKYFIKKENKIISDARSVNSNLTFFKNKFKPPLDNAIITGVYGSQRILNGKPKWPHYGIDFAAKEGTQIKAMLDGTATMVEKDLFYTGGTLIFDHGHGISTLYMHMQKIYVKKGQKVKQGEVIGTVGSTGRSTGAHLDVRLNWFGTRLDPMTVLNIK